MADKKERESIIGEIRYLLKYCGTSRYRIAQETDVSEASLSHFVNGMAGLSNANLDELCEYLDIHAMRVRAKPKPSKRKQAKGPKVRMAPKAMRQRKKGR